MIKQAIARHFPHHLGSCYPFLQDVYIADYTEKTKTEHIKKYIEFLAIQPNDINFFSLYNPNLIKIDGIKFNNASFLDPNGQAKTQCECTFFPESSTNSSWIMFLELKYSCINRRNDLNIKKALDQLCATYHYYKEVGIIPKNGNSYLIVSLPEQHEPFVNSIITPAKIKKYKKLYKIILRPKNKVQIANHSLIYV